MCFALPLKVKKVNENSAIMEDNKTVVISLLNNVKKNQWLLVKSNLAVQKLTEKEALTIRNTIKEINDEFKI